MNHIFIDSSVEQDALTNNLEFYFPLQDQCQWGSFYGRTGINRCDFDLIVATLGNNFKTYVNFDNRPYFIRKNSIEKIVFMTLWCVRLKKTYKDCAETFNLTLRESKDSIQYVLEYVLGDLSFEKHIHEAFAWSPLDEFPNKELVKASDFLD